MKRTKEKVVIDVIYTEDSGEVYFLAAEKGYKGLHLPAARQAESGLFLDSDELDIYLEENEESLEVVKDHRK